MPTRFTPLPGGIAAAHPRHPLWTKEGWAERCQVKGRTTEEWSQCTLPASQTRPWQPVSPCAAPYATSAWKTPTLCSAPPSRLTSFASLAPDRASNSKELVARCIVPVGRSALWWAPTSLGLSCRVRLQPFLQEMWKWKKRETLDFFPFLNATSPLKLLELCIYL